MSKLLAKISIKPLLKLISERILIWAEKSIPAYLRGKGAPGAKKNEVCYSATIIEPGRSLSIEWLPTISRLMVSERVKGRVHKEVKLHVDRADAKRLSGAIENVVKAQKELEDKLNAAGKIPQSITIEEIALQAATCPEAIAEAHRILRTFNEIVAQDPDSLFPVIVDLSPLIAGLNNESVRFAKDGSNYKYASGRPGCRNSLVVVWLSAGRSLLMESVQDPDLPDRLQLTLTGRLASLLGATIMATSKKDKNRRE